MSYSENFLLSLKPLILFKLYQILSENIHIIKSINARPELVLKIPVQKNFVKHRGEIPLDSFYEKLTQENTCGKAPFSDKYAKPRSATSFKWNTLA